MRHDERRAPGFLDNMRHGKSFARAGDTEQHLSITFQIALIPVQGPQ